MKLIICEKPSVAMEFGKALGLPSSARKNGYLEANDWIITWAVGHLVTLSYPEKYDENLKKWRMEDLPFIPEKYKYEVIDNVKDQFKIVKGLLQRKDVDTIYNAGDSGREGEYIQRLIFQEAKPNPNATILRIWIDSQTEEAIQNGIANARPASDFDSMSAAAYERAIEDYLAGINFSRAYSLRYGTALNHIYGSEKYIPIAIGRVMTCVLGMIVERERLVRDYKAEFSYGIQAIIDNGITADWYTTDRSQYFESPLLAKEDAFLDQTEAQKLCDQLNINKTLCVTDINRKTEQKKAPLLFNLAELQAECSRLFKISPTETLDIAQSLYEKKLTTYPRTDARVMSTAVAKEVNNNIQGLKNVTELQTFVDYIMNNKTYQNIGKESRYVDDTKITDHYAIIPTGSITNIGALSRLEMQVFILICKRFLSIFYPATEIGKIAVTFMQENESFDATASLIKTLGWREVINYEEDDEKRELFEILNKLTIGQRMNAEFNTTEKKSTKPKRYTSGTIVLAMENAGKLIEDEELRAQISGSGIGTSATRAETVNKLVKNQYINLNEKTQILTPTELGEMIYCVVSETAGTLLNPAFTANWEKGLSQVENKIISSEVYRDKLASYVRATTNELKNNDRSAIINQKLNEIHVLYGGKPIDFNSMNSRSGESIPGISCPNCQSNIVSAPWGFKCEKYKNGCEFTVGEIAGVKIDNKQLTKILTKGESDKLKFKKKDGSGTYENSLILTDDGKGGKRIGFKPFENRNNDSKSVETVDCNCPNCNKPLITSPWGFKCETCKFSVGEIGGIKLKLNQIKEIINTGKTSEKLKFKKKDGSGTYEAYLSLQNDEKNGGKKIWLDFN